jgi:predicted nucleotidyltransferase
MRSSRRDSQNTSDSHNWWLKGLDTEEKLQRMVEVARTLANDLMKEKYAIGAFLFGSTASGHINEESDVDLAVVYNTVATDIQVGKEERRIDDTRVEIWRYPIGPFIHTFEDEQLRGKPDTWMWASLWVEYMQTGLILADPTARLAKWTTKAKVWKWRENEIKPALKQARDNLRSSERYLDKQNPFASLICLREATTCLSAAYIMKHELIPSFRPKELSVKLELIKDKEKDLSAAFDLVNDAAVLDYNSVEGLLFRLKEFVDTEWGPKRMGPRTELENARGCLQKRNLVEAILSLRYSAYWLGFHILNKRGAKQKAEICNGTNHVEMMNHLAATSPPFYEFYKQLQFTERWSAQQVEATINQVRTVLGNWQK